MGQHREHGASWGEKDSEVEAGTGCSEDANRSRIRKAKAHQELKPSDNRRDKNIHKNFGSQRKPKKTRGSLLSGTETQWRRLGYSVLGSVAQDPTGFLATWPRGTHSEQSWTG